LEEAKQKEDEKDVKQLRKNLVHKPTSVPKFAPVPQRLTIPTTLVSQISIFYRGGPISSKVLFKNNSAILGIFGTFGDMGTEINFFVKKI
jgi:hypothetical protein